MMMLMVVVVMMVIRPFLFVLVAVVVVKEVAVETRASRQMMLVPFLSRRSGLRLVRCA